MRRAHRRVHTGARLVVLLLGSHLPRGPADAATGPESSKGLRRRLDMPDPQAAPASPPGEAGR